MPDDTDLQQDDSAPWHEHASRPDIDTDDDYDKLHQPLEPSTSKPKPKVRSTLIALALVLFSLPAGVYYISQQNQQLSDIRSKATGGVYGTGAACTPGTTLCDSGFFCSPSSRTCQPIATPGGNDASCDAGHPCANGYKCSGTTVGSTCVPNPETISCGRNKDTKAPVCCYDKSCANGQIVCEQNNRLECKTGGTWCTIEANSSECGGVTPGSSPPTTVTPTGKITTTTTPTGKITPTPQAKPSPTPPISCTKPADIMLVIDRSSTMNEKESDGRKKLDWAKDGAKAFIQAIQASGTTNIQIGISSFGAQGNDGTGILTSGYDSTLNTGHSNNYPAVLTALGTVNYYLPGTCIECGLRIANDQLKSTTVPRYVILLSDGMGNHVWSGQGHVSATDNGIYNAIAAANAGRSTGIVYYAIGYGSKTAGQIDEPTLISIAGSSSRYQYKPNVADWTGAFLSILPQICK